MSLTVKSARLWARYSSKSIFLQPLAPGMAKMVEALKSVFRDRLAKLDWMGDDTPRQSIGEIRTVHQKSATRPSSATIRACRFNRTIILATSSARTLFSRGATLSRCSARPRIARMDMTPQTVNAYFNPLQNEIVFPAAISSLRFSISRWMMPLTTARLGWSLVTR